MTEPPFITDPAETLPRTLVEALGRLEPITHKGYTFLNSDGSETHYAFQQLVEEARRRGRHLQALGLQKGDRLGLVIPEPEDFVLTFLGAMTVGVVPVPMYPPLALGKLDSYIDGARRILHASKARMVVTSKRVSSVLWSLVDKVEGLEDIVLIERLKEPISGAFEPVEIGPEDTCFLQFTSGSTADPKGVVVSHQNLVANAVAIMVRGVQCDAEKDKCITWLPLYHDMGLIGFVLSPLVSQNAAVLIPTMSFVKRPTIWLDTISKHRGTLTFAPNFAFALAAKYASRQIKPGFDLSSIRVLGCGAEPINAATLNRFIDAFTPAGLNPHAVMPAYGMAEATLAMSFDSLEARFHSERIDREAYENEALAKPASTDDAIEVVACGRAFAEHALGIIDEAGRLLPDRAVGEIVFSGPSVTRGYFENPTASAEAIQEGWLRTGDLGFMIDGEIYISGRKKDLIILNGRNYHPQAIEWEVEAVDGVRKGNAVAFAVAGEKTERLVVVAETRKNEPAAITAAIRTRLSEALGLMPSEVVLLPAGALPKTSSGKLQRKKTKLEWEAGTLGKIGTRGAPNGARVQTLLARHLASSLMARVKHRVRRFAVFATGGRSPGEEGA